MYQPKRINILGVGVSAVNMQMTLEIIRHWIEQRESRYICLTSVHGVMESHDHSKVKKVHNSSGLTTPDGMPLVWLSWLKGYPKVQRVYGPDLMLALCQYSIAQGYSHYFYGGTQSALEKLVANLQEQFPGICISGYYSPPFRTLTAEEDAEIVDMINASHADIVWIALGAPKQEIWMSEHIERLASPVLIGVGAAFDFLSGEKKQAPLWMQRSGLEWFFRLLNEPSRLWKRYLYNNPRFVWYVTMQALGLRKYDLNEA